MMMMMERWLKNTCEVPMMLQALLFHHQRLQFLLQLPLCSVFACERRLDLRILGVFLMKTCLIQFSGEQTTAHKPKTEVCLLTILSRLWDDQTYKKGNLCCRLFGCHGTWVFQIEQIYHLKGKLLFWLLIFLYCPLNQNHSYKALRGCLPFTHGTGKCVLHVQLCNS